MPKGVWVKKKNSDKNYWPRTNSIKRSSRNQTIIIIIIIINFIFAVVDKSKADGNMEIGGPLSRLWH